MVGENWILDFEESRLTSTLLFIWEGLCDCMALFVCLNGEVINRYAFVAQSVERLICNQDVVGSSPIGSFGVEQFGVATEL